MGSSLGTIGTVVGGIGGAIVGGPLGAAVGAGVGGLLGGSQDAANAQGQIAEAQLKQQQGDRSSALSYAEATPTELAQIQRGIALNEADIVRKEKLIASSDPALIEAGAQALKLLRGEEAKSLSPLKSQIAKQEQTLRQKLQAQLGTGYENSTAGIQALQAFNEQANNALSSAQQQSLGQLLGVAQDTSGRYGSQSNIENSGTLSQLFGDIQKRKVSALTGTPITGAGAQFVGDLQSSRGLTNSIGQIANIGATLYGANAGGAGGGAATPNTGFGSAGGSNFGGSMA